MFRSLLKQQEHLQVKTEETRLACFQCICLHCQITLLFSPGCPNWSCIACDCHAFWALFPCESTNFYNTKLCCGDNLLLQKEAVIRQNRSTLQWHSDKSTWPRRKETNPREDSKPTKWASKHVTHPSLRGKKIPNPTLIYIAKVQAKGFAAQTQPGHDRGRLIPIQPLVIPHLNTGEPGTDASLHSYVAEVDAQSPKALVLLLCSSA